MLLPILLAGTLFFLRPLDLSIQYIISYIHTSIQTFVFQSKKWNYSLEIIICDDNDDDTVE